MDTIPETAPEITPEFPPATPAADAPSTLPRAPFPRRAQSPKERTHTLYLADLRSIGIDQLQASFDSSVAQYSRIAELKTLGRPRTIDPLTVNLASAAHSTQTRAKELGVTIAIQLDLTDASNPLAEITTGSEELLASIQAAYRGSPTYATGILARSKLSLGDLADLEIAIDRSLSLQAEELA